MDRSGEMMVFVHAVEEGSFSGAARRLHLTPSAVSKLITRLEDRLGVRLLHRTTRMIRLTHEGVAFYQRSAHILKEIDEAEEAISQLQRAPRGILRVNATTAFCNYQIVSLLPEFFDRYPDISIQLSATDRIVDLVEEGVDVAVRIGVPRDDWSIVRLIAEDRRLVVAAPRYIERFGAPKTPQDLAAHNCMTWLEMRADLNDWPFVGPDGPFTVRASGNTSVNNGEALHETVVSGLGIGRLAEFRVGADIKAGRLVPLLTEFQPDEAIPIHAVYPHRRHLLPKVRVFVDYLIEKFSPVPPWRVE